VPEPALTDTELRIVRGMIDEYRYDIERGRERRRALSTGEAILAAIVGVALVSLQLASLLIAIMHHAN
jgi:hypothetical protein